MVTDLGLGVWRAETVFDGSYLDDPWARSVGPSSVSLLLCRRQDGQVLGPRDEQGHPALSRPLLGCLLLVVSLLNHPYLHQWHELTVSVHPTLDVLCTAGRDASVRVSYLIPIVSGRADSPGLGYADTSQYLHTYRTHEHGRRRQDAGLGSPDHLWVHGQYRPTLGFGCRQVHDNLDAPQEVCSRPRHPSGRVQLRQCQRWWQQVCPPPPPPSPIAFHSSRLASG